VAKSAKYAAIALVVAVMIGAVFAAIVVVKSAAVAEANHGACEAARANNDILRDLIAHIEHRSLISIREGVTQDITADVVRSFYDPTLRRIDAVSC
jgi:hypothetical protein